MKAIFYALALILIPAIAQSEGADKHPLFLPSHGEASEHEILHRLSWSAMLFPEEVIAEVERDDMNTSTDQGVREMTSMTFP